MTVSLGASGAHEPAVALGRAERSSFNLRSLATLRDGSTVEVVRYRGDTLCVSSQVGCAVGCPFCASGKNGLDRALTLEELKGQVLAAEAMGGPLRRVTISGVGEPLHNAAIFEFISWCRERQTPASVTTSGGPVHRLGELLGTPHNGVTISVHAGTEAVRRAMVPRGPSLAALFSALAATVPTLSNRRRKKLACAYLLVRDENDSAAELDAFAERAVALGVAIHLYALNPVDDPVGVSYRPVPRAQYEAAYERLRGAGLVVRMSSQARIEHNGGCGTLVARERLTKRRRA